MENSSKDGNTRPTDLPPEYLFARQEATIRIGHRTMDWFKIWKGVCQSYILSLCLFKLICRVHDVKSGWMNHKLESKLLRVISTSSDMQMISL